MSVESWVFTSFKMIGGPNFNHPRDRPRTAQAALKYLGIDPGPIDGLRGRSTRSALVRFQEKSGLPVTGEFDEDTETKLLAEAFPA